MHVTLYLVWLNRSTCFVVLFFFFNDTAPPEIYTSFPTRRSSDQPYRVAAPVARTALCLVDGAAGGRRAARRHGLPPDLLPPGEFLPARAVVLAHRTLGRPPELHRRVHEGSAVLA